MSDRPARDRVGQHSRREHRGRPIVPVGGGVPVDETTGERYGYLPRRASRRKILIRSQLGVPWLAAALASAAVILVAGAAFLALRPAVPGPPFVDQGPLERYADGTVTPLLDGSGWLDRRGGLAAVGEPVAFCPGDGGWVGPAGNRYDAAGRSAGRGPGLSRITVRVSGGRVYVDPTSGTRTDEPAAAMSPCPAPQQVGDPTPPDGL